MKIILAILVYPCIIGTTEKINTQLIMLNFIDHRTLFYIAYRSARMYKQHVLPYNTRAVRKPYFKQAIACLKSRSNFTAT